MEKNPMELTTPIIISKCLDPECASLYKCTLENQNCKIKIPGEDGRCTRYKDCAEDEKTKLSHGYCDKGCVEKVLIGLSKYSKEE